MNVRCEHCGLDMEVPPHSEGQTLRCPECGGTFVCKLPHAIVVDNRDDQEGAEEVLLLDEVVEGDKTDPAGDLLAELTLEKEEESPLAAAAAAAKVPADEALAEMGKAAPKRIVKENPRQWYVMVGGVAAAALTYKDLTAKAGEGKIKPRTKIYYAPAGLTVQAQDVPGLFPELYAKRKKKGKSRLSRKPSAAASSGVIDLAEALGHLGEKKE